MTVYIIGDIEVTDAEAYARYVEQAPAHVTRHQGEYLVRGGDPERFEGDWNPTRIVVLRFPSREHARALLDDPAYQAVAETRRAATTSRMIVVDGA
jgi:uncharacterized protein (DUF1330 family)